MQRPRFGLSAAQIERWIKLIEMRSFVLSTPAVDVSGLRDPKDAKFLSAAVGTNADFLVTGDNDLLQSRLTLATRIVTIADFAQLAGIA